MKHKKQKKSVNFAKQTLGLYWQHVRKDKILFGISIILIPISALLLTTLVPYYLSQAVGQLASKNTSSVTPLLMAASVAGGVGIIINYIGFQTYIRHQAKMVARQINYLSEELLSKDYAFFSNSHVGALTTKFNDFIRSFTALEELFVIRTLGFIISMGAGMILVAIKSWQLAMILLIYLLILTIQIRVTLKIRQPFRTERKDIRSNITGDVADMLTNNLVVRTFANESIELRSITTKTARFMKLLTNDLSIIVTDGTLRHLITTIVQIVAILFALTQLRTGAIDVATTVFALSFLQRVAGQMFTLGEMINGYDLAFLEAAPMTEILLKDNKITDSEHAPRLHAAQGDISFNNVGYAYEEGDEAIKGFDLNIKGGRKIGIVGHSGAGKTTITKLLLRFDDVTSGEILIDDQNISHVTQRSLRQSISYVPQEPLLFHKSLEDNIRYGKPGATDEDVKKAAQQANAHEFIEKLADGYKTLVGERGVKLSGGQRQRVAIARAILKDAPILMLDEATSALDSESEKLIQDALKKLMHDKTSIVIAHRLSTIQNMDTIIVMEDGKIFEQGSHDNLLQKNGKYATLWAHQSGGFIED
jgi:ATP-binding cassette subfamily B protein